MTLQEAKEEVKKTNHPKTREKIAESARDEARIVAKDALKYLSEKPASAPEEERRKIEEVVDYYKPRWRGYMKREPRSRKTFFFDFGEKPVVKLSKEKLLKVRFPVKV